MSCPALPLRAFFALGALALAGQGLVSAASAAPAASAVAPVRAWAVDLNADGHVETAFVRFAGPLASAPAGPNIRLDLTNDRFQSMTLGVDQVSLQPGDPSLVRLDLRNGFPHGSTGWMAHSRIAFGKEPGIDAGAVPVADSVAPVLMAADYVPPDYWHPTPILTLRFSEPVSVPLPLAPGGLSFHCVQCASGAKDSLPRIVSARMTREDEVEISLDPASAWLPQRIDSLALTAAGGFADGAGNRLRRSRRLPLDGSPLRSPYEPLPVGLRTPARPAAPAFRAASPWLSHGRRLDGAALETR